MTFNQSNQVNLASVSNSKLPDADVYDHLGFNYQSQNPQGQKPAIDTNCPRKSKHINGAQSAAKVKCRQTILKMIELISRVIAFRSTSYGWFQHKHSLRQI